MMKTRVSQEDGHGEEKDRYKNTNQTETECIISPFKEIFECYNKHILLRFLGFLIVPDILNPLYFPDDIH